MASNDSGGAAPADHVVMVLSPLLIMALVGSLVFFLLEILYAGQHMGRMQWILFFYVFGTVLTARVSLTPDISFRSHLYGLVLVVLVWMALQKFVEYPPHLARQSVLINLGVVLLAWWCAHRLTWDCTHLDDSVGASGEGVLQAAGLETSSEPEPASSLERYQRKQKSEEGKKRTPGVWVVYFSLAALPLFGLGQSLIPPEDLERRRYTFWLLVIYTGAGLGLLLTTSFLGLRLYLLRRRLRMPLAMTASWLGLGAILVLVLLALAALLPRPSAEMSILDINPARSREREASRRTARRDGSGKEKGETPGEQQGEKDARPSDRPRTTSQGGQDGQKDRGSGKDGQNGRGSQDRQSGQGEQDRSGDKSGESSQQEPSSSANSVFQKLLPILKWIVFGLLALIVLVVAVRAFLRFAAGSSNWARNLLNFLRRFWEGLLGLFGQRKPKDQESQESEEERLATLPFESFSNPFADGRADRMSPGELIRYTFAALEAWGRERDLARGKGETALEFAGRLGEESPPLERELKRLAQLYSLTVYGRGGVPANAREILEQFWETLERTTAQPLSA